MYAICTSLADFVRAAAHANRVWSYDFVSAMTHDGRTVRTLNPIDEHSHRVPDDPAGMAVEFDEGRRTLRSRQHLPFL